MATTPGTPATPATSSTAPGGAAAAARGARRTERLLNLVIALSATRRWLTKEQIRTAVPQYADCATTVAFERMFERDKEDLRELGVPLETGGEDPLFEDEAGYRIDREAYALPEIRFTPGELAVLSLASRVWQQASLAGPATRALVKLRSLGVEPDESSLIGVEPRVRTAEPAFDPLYAATRDRTPVSFTYRRAGGEPAIRHVEPWAIVSWHGRWYLVGHDRDRDASRVFRLSRVASAVKRIGKAGSYRVPEGIDPREIVAGTIGPATTREARLRVRSGAGLALRRRARAVEPGEGEDVVVVDVSDVEMSADELAAYGADVLVLEPQDLREAVVRRLRGAAGVAP
jgi:proteasome accessory factor B